MCVVCVWLIFKLRGKRGGGLMIPLHKNHKKKHGDMMRFEMGCKMRVCIWHA